MRNLLEGNNPQYHYFILSTARYCVGTLPLPDYAHCRAQKTLAAIRALSYLVEKAKNGGYERGK